MKKIKIQLTCAALALCALFSAGCGGKAAPTAASPEFRSSGEYLQYRNGENGEWINLIRLDDIKGSSGSIGENGKNGADGKNGNDGVNGKSVEIRKSDTCIQWRYENGEWKDLVELSALIGADGARGENGADGKDGTNGKDGKDGKDGLNGKDGAAGADGKSVEIKKTAAYIQWRLSGGEWQNLIALSDLEGPAGQNGKNGKDGSNGTDGVDGENGKTPEFRADGNILKWRYIGDEIWLNLYDLSLLKGKDGTKGNNGADGKTPFIGENGNWWIGDTDTGVKAAGQNGENGTDGKNGDTPFIGYNGNWWIGDTDTGVKAAGTNGENGKNGKDGKDGLCAGYFAANGRVYSWGTPLPFTVKKESGNLISYNSSGSKITLSKGHTYSLMFSGTVMISANGVFKLCGVSLIDGYNSSEMALETRTFLNMRDDGESARLPVSYNTVYTAENDITLTFQFTNMFFQSTSLIDSQYSITVIALD